MSPTASTAVVRHAAPVLLNKKPAALFTLPHHGQELTDFMGELTQKGLQVRQMRRYRNKALLFVYHPGLLSQALAHPLAQSLLLRYGYPGTGSLEDTLQYLRRRMAKMQEFPHEIGLFLGYPPEDVAGFIRHQGSHYKLCGKWKVYGDVERAKALFCEYDRCSECLQRHLNSGGRLSDFTAAAYPTHLLEVANG